VEEQDLWIVMPWLEAGSCAHVMKTMAPTGLKDDALIATILKEVLLGLQYFHNDGRLHRDLKAGNIIISKSGEVMLADFGVAGTLMENGDRKKARKTFTGTPCWMAPGMCSHLQANQQQC
jgi:serine/threonine-protein kinase OSR1/STK39